MKMAHFPLVKGFEPFFTLPNCRRWGFGPHTGKNDGSLAIPVHHASQCLQSCMECASGNGRPSTLHDPGVRQLKIHKSSKSGLVAAFMCQVFEFFCCMYVVWCCKLWYNVFGGIPYET